MSELSLLERFRDELTAGCLGYGNGVMNCTAALYWFKAIADRDLMLGALMLLSALPIAGCRAAMLEFLGVMGKDDGEKAARYETVFRVSAGFGMIQFFLMYRYFLMG
jgi:hypothetical protein